ncbi:MAG: neutral/alkaline non-lysosomal ceramidase N-terminal domain-containing protein [Cytophagaceae bacterium]
MSGGLNWKQRIGKVVNSIFHILDFLMLGLFLIAFSLFTTVQSESDSWKPFQLATFQTIDSAKTLTNTNREDTILYVGWDEVSIVPNKKPFPIAGYGIREWVSKVRDTTKARIIYWKQGNVEVAMITLDLLIFPPLLKNKLVEELADKEGIQCYLSATHTHSAPGGWADRSGGHFLAGQFHPEYLDSIYNQIISSVKKAKKTALPTQVAYVSITIPKAVQNRLVGDKGKVDTWLRGLNIKREDSSQAILFTYAAHANCLDTHIDSYSGDYPNVLIDSLLHHKYQFATYMAGAVGSHGPHFHDYNGETNLRLTANAIWDSLSQVKDFQHITSNNKIISYMKVPIYFGESQMRISPYFRIRPWVFSSLLGDDQPTIQAFKVGPIVFLGLPCDYSGEFMEDLQNVADKYNNEVVVTGFNGGYIGYITPDKYYFLNRGEVRDMNWYGPGNGRYFMEMNTRIIQKMQK